jgi:D-hydroxyproline dehydrogenase subunit beta
VVVGAGIVGCATAYELARRGVSVCLVDRGGVSGGTTGLGEGNVLCSDKRPGAELSLAVRGLALFDEIEGLLGEEASIRRKGALVVHAWEEGWRAEPARLEALRTGGVRCSSLAADEVHEAEPELRGGVLGASYFPDDLQCAPRAIAIGLAREAERLGAVVQTGREVLSIVLNGGHEEGVRDVPSDMRTFRDEPPRGEGARHVAADMRTFRDGPPRGEGVRHVRGDMGAFRDGPLRVEGVVTREGSVRAGHVVVACGPWSAPLARSAGVELPLEPRKGQLVRLERRPGFLRHKVIEGGYMAAVANADAGLLVSPVIETTLDGYVLVGSSRERRGFDLSVDPKVSDALLREAARLAPGIAELAFDSAWAGLRPWLPGGLPAIGPTSAAEGLFIATGHEGAGVAHGPITGRLIAQAICGEKPDLPLASFDPDRFSPG